MVSSAIIHPPCTFYLSTVSGNMIKRATETPQVTSEETVSVEDVPVRLLGGNGAACLLRSQL